jgi:hypothetical protein
MEVTGLKRVPILKTGQKASRLKFVGTTGHNDKKRDNPVLNGTYGHPKLIAISDINTLTFINRNTYQQLIFFFKN